MGVKGGVALLSAVGAVDDRVDGLGVVGDDEVVVVEDAVVVVDAASFNFFFDETFLGTLSVGSRSF